MISLTGTPTSINHLKLVSRVHAATRDGRAMALVAASTRGRRIQNGLVLALSDATALLLCAAATTLVAWASGVRPQHFGWMWWLPALHAAAACFRGLYPSWGVGRVDALRRMLTTIAAACGLTAAIIVALGDAPDPAFFLTAATAPLVVPVLAVRARRHLQAQGRWGMPVVVYGAGEDGRALLRHLKDEPAVGLRPVAVVDDDPLLQGRVVAGHQVLGRPGDRVPITDAAVLAMSESEHRRVLLDRLTAHYNRVIVLGDVPVGAPAGRPRDYDGLNGIELRSRLACGRGRLLKRTADVLLLGLTASLWIPVLGLVAACIWLEDRHSPFTRQVRVGRDGVPFENIRFRTVVPDTGDLLRSYLQADEGIRSEWETQYTLSTDPRVTRVGRFLRRTGLDALPQVINVLRGEMALVGPQPLPPHRYTQLTGSHKRMLQRAAPGVTGLWSIYGIDDSRSVDARYIVQWSLLLDASILLERWTDLFAEPYPRPRPSSPWPRVR